MKTKYLYLTFYIMPYLFFAQTGINYKALLKDSNGNVITNDLVQIQFTILQGATTVYEESHNPTTDGNGLVIVNIGLGTPISGTFNTIDWAAGDHFLNVQVNTGSGLVDLGTTQFMAVPYALSAENVVNGVSRLNDLADSKTDNTSVFIGFNSGAFDDGSTNFNTGIGISSLANNTSGYDNTSVGYLSLASNTEGRDNTAVGAGALNRNTTGVNNVAIGSSTLSDNESGFENTAIGFWAMLENVAGNRNNAIGTSSLFKNVNGSSNNALGNAAGRFVDGSNNVFLGHRAGAGTELHNKNGSVFIGYEAGENEVNSNRLYIENSNSSSPLIYGEFDNDLLRINGVLDINNTYQLPSSDGLENQILQTDGTGSVSWQTVAESSGLEALDEGNGIGWRLKGSDPANYGNLGQNAVDFSTSDGTITNAGATGSFSTATGFNTVASGDDSTAMGFSTVSSGSRSMASGNGTRAVGSNSTAMGDGSVAEGRHSTALGSSTFSPSFAETVLGIYNTIYTPVSADSYNLLDRLFVIGNGINSSSRMDALVILKNGTITAPSLDINEITDDKALITKEYADTNLISSGLEALNEGNGIGWRLKEKNPVNYGDIGENAVDLSVSTIASTLHGATGEFSLAFGAETQASGNTSTAMGYDTTASGIRSTAMGSSTTASGNDSTAMGSSTEADGLASTAMGFNTEASGEVSTAMGSGNNASGGASTAMGFNTDALGNISTAMGTSTQAPSYVETVMGQYNTTYIPASASGWNTNDRLFTVGNGTNSANRNNALTLLKNGDIGINKDNPENILDIETASSDFIRLKTNTGNARLILDGSSGNSAIEWQENSSFQGSIGWDATSQRMFCFVDDNVWYAKNGRLGVKDTDPSYALELPNNNNFTIGRARANAWETYSDARVKTNGQVLGYGLKEVLKLEPKSYDQHASSFENGKVILESKPMHTIGLFAQEVYKIIPEAVNKPENENEDLWAMDYEKLVPVLINAIKEQQKIIEFERTLNNENKELINNLLDRVEALEGEKSN